MIFLAKEMKNTVFSISSCVTDSNSVLFNYFFFLMSIECCLVKIYISTLYKNHKW